MVNIVTVFGSESGDLQSKISASIAKKRALDTLNKARLFLCQQKSMSRTIQESMLNENVAGSIYNPVCFLEVNNTSNQVEKNIFNSNYLKSVDKRIKEKLIADFSSGSLKWQKLSKEDQKNISMYLDNELNTSYSATDSHSVRVREMIQKLSAIDTIQGVYSK